MASTGIFKRLTDALLPKAGGARFFSREAPAGEVVTADNAMGVPAIMTCVRVLAESIAMLPLDLKVRDENGASTDATDDPLHDLFRWQANPEQSAYDFRLWVVAESLLRSAGYAQIVRNMNGDIIELWPLESRRVSPMRAPDGSLWFEYCGRTFHDEEIFRVQVMPGGCGIIPASLIDTVGGALGAVKAANDSAGEFLGGAAQINGILKVAGTLTDEQYARVKADFEKNYAGKGKRHLTPILEAGTDFTPFTLDAQETQLLETRKFDRSTVAGIFRVPPHLIGDLEKATFSNIEEQQIQFVVDSLLPHLTNWEQRLSMSFLGKDRRAKGYYWKFNVNARLRGNSVQRNDAYGKAINAGWMSPNDVRRLEDLPPVAGGDQYFVQGALRPITEPYQASTSTASTTIAP